MNREKVITPELAVDFFVLDVAVVQLVPLGQSYGLRLVDTMGGPAYWLGYAQKAQKPAQKRRFGSVDAALRWLQKNDYRRPLEAPAGV